MTSPYEDLSVPQAAAKTQISKSVLYEALRSGKVRGAYKQGNAWRIPPASLRAWSRGDVQASRPLGLNLPSGTLRLLHILANEREETAEDLVYRLLEAEQQRRLPPERLLDVLELKGLLAARPRDELDYTLEDYVHLEGLTGGQREPCRRLQAILRRESEDHGALRLGFVLRALADFSEPASTSLDRAMAAGGWSFSTLRDEITRLAPKVLEQSLRDYLRPSIADLEPADLDLRRHLSGLPFGDGVKLAQVKSLLDELHPSVDGLLVGEHERTAAESPAFQTTPWVLRPAGAQCSFAPRPAFTVDAIRFSFAHRPASRGLVRVFVFGLESWREVAVWERRDLARRGEPLRVKVPDCTVPSCLHRLAFSIGGSYHDPQDTIEVWARPPTAWERRKTAILTPMQPGRPSD